MTELTKRRFEATSVDTKEFELPETVFVRDIENRVFQAIVLQCLAKVKEIGLVEGNLIDNIFSRSHVEGVKGIYAEQDSKSHSVKIRVEVNVAYGVTLPAKASEIQEKISEEITRLTGLHVACVHVVFKNLISPAQLELSNQVKALADKPDESVEDAEAFAQEIK
jgi:uncharacterized alkaline shock family protein YloU